MVLLLASRVPDDQFDALLADLDGLLLVGSIDSGRLLFVEGALGELSRQRCLSNTG